MRTRTANLSINGFRLVSGEPACFTIVDGSTRYGVVIRTGSNVVKIRQADGTERELGQCSITHITQSLTDAEMILWECGYVA